jgi:ABC-2 type transport system ATP-binding protein
MSAGVELVGVRKSFDGIVAVDDLSLAIPPGAIFGLLGPNGAGKTTAIRMLIGILLPDAGEVRIFGAPVSRDVTRRIGYLPEERGLYRRMTVEDNLVFVGRLAGLAARDARVRALKWARRMVIDRWMSSRVEELSKGMQQRVQFIAALVHEPDLVVMDEPFSGLDPINVNELNEILLDLKRSGRTILLSTHRMDQAERLCDEICLVNRGRGVLSGPIRQIRSANGRCTLRIEIEGDLASLARFPGVECFIDRGNHADIVLCPGADSQDLLRRAMRLGRVLRFELREPSLEDVFVSVVGERNG